MAWVQNYMNDYRVKQIQHIKSEIQKASKEYGNLVNDCIQINRIVNATEHSLHMINTIDLMLLKRIEK